ncbi:UNKNOWN [Stylonychia lemnae]|uniref:Transmembrane protein n=1 Tax=Stylonychia lemnae TaxID=5949 RepID=A0A078B9R4_STYLE|nr:UNKNOWN [Stylonychia lemnae]|eukprot:CDW89997.1 UNKNOWN [Stylonychia lemnae]
MEMQGYMFDIFDFVIAISILYLFYHFASLAKKEMMLKREGHISKGTLFEESSSAIAQTVSNASQIIEQSQVQQKQFENTYKNYRLSSSFSKSQLNHNSENATVLLKNQNRSTLNLVNYQKNTRRQNSNEQEDLNSPEDSLFDKDGSNESRSLKFSIINAASQFPRFGMQIQNISHRNQDNRISINTEDLMRGNFGSNKSGNNLQNDLSK